MYLTSNKIELSQLKEKARDKKYWRHEMNGINIKAILQKID